MWEENNTLLPERIEITSVQMPEMTDFEKLWLNFWLALVSNTCLAKFKRIKHKV